MKIQFFLRLGRSFKNSNLDELFSLQKLPKHFRSTQFFSYSFASLANRLVLRHMINCMGKTAETSIVNDSTQSLQISLTLYKANLRSSESNRKTINRKSYRVPRNIVRIISKKITKKQNKNNF